MMKNQKSLPFWRSLLYVPSNNERFVSKASKRGADAIILDLEDSVPPAEKDAARKACVQAIDRLQDASADLIVRINAPLRLAVRDLEACIRSGVTAIFVPKVESGGALAALCELVSELEQEASMEEGAIAFVPLLETPAALFHAHEIARATPRNVAMALGSEDFATAAGFEPSGETLAHPKIHVAMAAKAAGLLALGLLDSLAGISDPDETMQVAKRSARFGFDGATCVHPTLVPVLNRAFAPTQDQVDLAHRTIAAMEKAWAEGRGAARLDGRMIDMPMLTRARALLEKVARITEREKASD